MPELWQSGKVSAIDGVWPLVDNKGWSPAEPVPLSVSVEAWQPGAIGAADRNGCPSPTCPAFPAAARLARPVPVRCRQTSLARAVQVVQLSEVTAE